MESFKLYMLLLGSKPPGRHTEQHDIYFGIGKNLAGLLPGIREFWPDAGLSLHIDAWRIVTHVDGYEIEIVQAGQKEKQLTVNPNLHLFFLNLGGYKFNEFEEYHYKMLVVANDLAAAKTKAKETAFFKHTHIPDDAFNKTAESHIDDKYGVDVDDIYEVKDILGKKVKEQFRILIRESPVSGVDEFHMGYLQLSKINFYQTDL